MTETVARRERIFGRFIEAQKSGRVWDVCILEEGTSKNGVHYPERVLREAAPLFEGAAAMLYGFEDREGRFLGPDQGSTLFDHLPDNVHASLPHGVAGNVVGWYDNVRFGTFTRDDGSKGRGLLAKLHLDDNTQADDLRRTMLNRWKSGAQNLGLSHDSGIHAVTTMIEGNPVDVATRFDEVYSVDVVTRPAAGGAVLRRVASMLFNKRKDRSMIRILETIMKHFAHWAEGFNVDGDDAENLVLPILEAALERTHEAVRLADDERKAEAEARGVTTLKKLITMLKGGDVEGAVQMLEEWASNYPAPAKESEEQEAEPDDDPPKEEEEEPEKEEEAPKEDAPADDGKDEELAAREAELRKRESALLLEERLSESKLPKNAADLVRNQFADRIVTEPDVDTAIEQARKVVESLSDKGKVRGCGEDVDVVQNQREKWGKAMLAMLIAEPEVDGVEAFRSIHESIAEITGFRGEPLEMGYKVLEGIAFALPAVPGQKLADHQQRHRESVVHVLGSTRRAKETLLSTTWSEVFGDSVTRMLMKEARKHPWTDWRKVASDIQNVKDFRTQRRERIGGFGDFDVVAEDGTYQEFATQPTDQEVTYAVAKRGNLYPYTLEAATNDDLSALRRIPRLIGTAGARTLYKQVFATSIFDNPTMDYDAVALINAAHNNSTASALAWDSLVAGILALQDQTEQDSGEPLALRPKYLLVPTELARTAWELVNAGVSTSAARTETVENWVGTFGIEVIVVPTETSAADWILMANPEDIPTIEVGFLAGRQEPEILVQDQPTVGSVFSNDRTTLKGRFIFGAEPLDHRGFYGKLA